MTDQDPYNPFTGGLTAAQTELVVSQLDDGTEIAEIMRQFYPILLERAWERAGQQVQLGLAFDLRNPRVQETITGLAQKVKRVADVTRDQVRSVLSRVDAEGLSYSQAAKLLRGVAETGPDGSTIKPFDSAYRSFMIAVTESAYAYSRGQVLAWGESGDVNRMQWVAETNACPICRKLDGVIVDLGKPFDGGLEVPAHPNCRCTLSPVLTDDFPLPAAPVSGPTSTSPSERPASIAIRADGTLDYTPSAHAERMYALLSDPSGEYAKTVAFYDAELASNASTLKRRQDTLFRETRLLASMDAGDPDRAATEARIKKANRDIQSITTKMKATEQQYAEAISRANPSAIMTGSTPSQVKYLWDQKMTPQQKIDVEQRVASATRILDSLMPSVSASGNPVNVGYQTGQALTVSVQMQLKRESAAHLPLDPVTGQRKPDSTSIRISHTSTMPTILHEMFHNITRLNPRITERVSAFTATRLRPGQPNTQEQSMNSLMRSTFYSSTEKARPDSFAHPYIGKVYTQAESSEVLPVFGTYIGSTPERRAIYPLRDDPEWVKFCIDVLADPGSYE